MRSRNSEQVLNILRQPDFRGGRAASPRLALDAIRRIPRFSDQLEKATARYWAAMERHKLYISEHGDDMPEVRDWRWTL